MMWQWQRLKQPKRVTTSSRGFTILELMVATSVFAVILLVLAAGVISFSRSYFTSVTRSHTQEAARQIMDDLVQGIEFAGKVTFYDTPGAFAVKGVCVDNTLYTFRIGSQVVAGPTYPANSHKYGLVKTIRNADCNTLVPPLSTPSDSATLTANQSDLLGQHMRLSQLSVVQIAPYTYDVHVRVLYGDNDQFTTTTNWAAAECKNQQGSQFCAVSDLTTTVQQRLQK